MMKYLLFIGALCAATAALAQSPSTPSTDPAVLQKSLSDLQAQKDTVMQWLQTSQQEEAAAKTGAKTASDNVTATQEAAREVMQQRDDFRKQVTALQTKIQEMEARGCR